MIPRRRQRRISSRGDALLPKANALTAQLETPQIAANKLSRLAKDLSDMQSQVGALEGLVK